MWLLYRHNPWVQILFTKALIIAHQRFFMLNSSTHLILLNSQFFIHLLPVLEINKAICGWIPEQEFLLVLPRQSHTHHVMTFRAFARYCCDDGATVSREKSVQAFPPIFLQSCETKSGTESLGSRLLWAYLSEPLVKDTVRLDSHKRPSSTEKPRAPSHVITHYRYVCVTERHTETLHVKKMADLVAISL